MICVYRPVMMCIGTLYLNVLTERLKKDVLYTANILIFKLDNTCQMSIHSKIFNVMHYNILNII